MPRSRRVDPSCTRPALSPSTGLLVAASVLLSVSGCTGTGENREPELPSHGVAVSEGSAEAQLSGSLEGEVFDGLACLSIVYAESGETYLLTWPAEFTARFDPLRVLDQNGETVATVGEEVTLTGGTADAEESPTTCGDLSGPEWQVGGV